MSRVSPAKLLTTHTQNYTHTHTHTHRRYNKLWSDHRDAGAPRPSKNIDVVRSVASVPHAHQVVAVYDELAREFGATSGSVQGVSLCKNNFTTLDASELSHYRAVYAIVEFAPRSAETFGEMAERCAAQWEAHVQARDPLEQKSVRMAIARLAKGGELGDAPVRLLCEVQILLDTYLRTRGSMHFLYKVKRASDPMALWRDFAGRVQPNLSEAS